MVREALQNTSVARLLAEVADDAGTLVRQEIQLAKAEVSAALEEKLRGLIYIIAAALLALVALILLALAIALGLMLYGVAPHWACAIVAVATGVLASIALICAKAMLSKTAIAGRSFNQMKQNVAAAKEAIQ